MNVRPKTSETHLSGYQARDYEVVDYEMYELGSTGLQFRGPPIDPESDYFACIGAAQTLGCFCDAPFPAIVAEEIGVPALNLGYGGAGPEFYLNQDALLPYLNKAKAVVIQVMSGRSQSNEIYECGGLEYVTMRRGGKRTGAKEAFREAMSGPSAIAALPWLGPKVARRLARPGIRRIVKNLRAAWVESNLRLIEKIEAPVVLLWYSKRTPEYGERYGTPEQLFGEFPHMITREQLTPLSNQAAAYVECVTDRGSPQPLFSRFTGEPTTVDTANDRPDLAVEPWTHNRYYPSPEMHEDAAAALAPALKAVLGRSLV